MALTFKEVAEILKLIDASQCDEVVLELEGTRLVVRRGGTGGGSTSATPSSSSGSSVQQPAPASAAAAPAGAAKPESAGDASEPGVVDVRSPMVGTFYRRPSPEEAPFVNEGSKVKKGDTLCLVEVMKLFTAVEATVDGTVVEIALEDGATIEFDQLLFRIRT